VSYILEALRKSDRERRLGRPPSLQSVVGDGGAPEHHVQRFVAGTLLIVLLAAVAIAGWYYFGHTSPETGTRVAVSTAKQALTAGPESPVESRNNPGQRQPGSRQLSPLQTVSKPASTDSPDNLAPVAASQTTIIEYINLDPAQRARWPTLTLNVISYGKMVKQRFVMINQKIFKTGQTVLKDLKLEKIEADAVILRADSLRFRLYPR